MRQTLAQLLQLLPGIRLPWINLINHLNSIT
jgi:hypothetical protein